ncbi:CARNS1 [Symbiodinium natans]|uniref:CARNS1 protein n=1 Tax=Symbiodinium natans TaxID=878477 RepID=A0A812RU05_9DINO|nr:CARNS1 [Symbiodinium natans]
MASGNEFQSFEEASDLPRRRRKRQKPVSFLRWLFFGKGGANKENRSWFRGRRSVRH